MKFIKRDGRGSYECKYKLIILFLATLSIFLMVSYLFIRGISVFATKFSFIDFTLNIILLLCELFIMIHTIGYIWNILSSYRLYKKERALLKKAEKYKYKNPPVAILIPVKDEPKNIIERTIITASELDYKHKSIYILDDSDNRKNIADIQWLERKYKKYGVKLFRRKKEERHGAKAGILNDIIPKLKEKYIAVFDSDQNPSTFFLKKLIPLLESKPSLVFIQTPQRYVNVEKNTLTKAAAIEQAYFYEQVCEGKCTKDAMLCCGTNFVMKRTPLLSVGGFDESSVTEDFATSVRIHQAGYDSYYYNHLSVFGMGPENLLAFFKQQSRWAQGNIFVLKKLIGEFLKNPRSMPIIKWWEYSISGSWYLIGIVRLFLILFPILYVLFNVPSIFINIPLYLAIFIPYFIFSFLLQAFVLGERGYKLKDIFRGLMLSYITYMVYARGAVYALINKKVKFVTTPKISEKRTPYKYLKVQILTLILNIGALIYGVYRVSTGTVNLPLIMNMGWLLLHSLIFSTVFYFNKK
jgi:cellulose synthase (UDP-forming)